MGVAPKRFVPRSHEVSYAERRGEETGRDTDGGDIGKRAGSAPGSEDGETVDERRSSRELREGSGDRERKNRRNCRMRAHRGSLGMRTRGSDL